MVILFPKNLTFPHHLLFHEEIADDMMRGNAVRIKRLNIDDKPSAVFQHTDTLSENIKQLFEITIPIYRVIIGVIIQAKVVWRDVKMMSIQLSGSFFSTSRQSAHMILFSYSGGKGLFVC